MLFRGQTQNAYDFCKQIANGLIVPKLNWRSEVAFINERLEDFVPLLQVANQFRITEMNVFCTIVEDIFPEFKKVAGANKFGCPVASRFDFRI